MRECRNCGTNLTVKDKNLACLRCQSAYLDMRFLQNYFREMDFQKLVSESRQLTSKSSQNCILCKKQLALHFVGNTIQVESCYPCQKVWFDSTELKKFQVYTQRRNEGKTIRLESDGLSDVPFSSFIFDETLDHSSILTTPSPELMSKFIFVEWISNLTLNKISDSNFFKKYPLLTFCFVVAALIWYFKK